MKTSELIEQARLCESGGGCKGCPLEEDWLYNCRDKLLLELADKLEEVEQKYQQSLEDAIKDFEKKKELQKALDKACNRISTIQGGGTAEQWKEWCLQNENK